MVRVICVKLPPSDPCPLHHGLFTQALRIWRSRTRAGLTRNRDRSCCDQFSAPWGRGRVRPPSNQYLTPLFLPNPLLPGSPDAFSPDKRFPGQSWKDRVGVFLCLEGENCFCSNLRNAAWSQAVRASRLGVPCGACVSQGPRLPQQQCELINTFSREPKAVIQHLFVVVFST